MTTPVEVVQQGFTWGSLVISAGVWGCLATIVTVFYKTRIPLKKIQADGDTSLREDLFEQLAKQEAESKDRVTKLETRLEDQRKMYETRIEYERLVHSSEIQTMRHKMNNLDQCLSMLLALIETNPDKAQEAAKRVREMRDKQEAAETAEKASLTAARVHAAVPPAANPTVP